MSGAAPLTLARSRPVRESDSTSSSPDARQVKPTILTVASLLTIVLLPLHVGGDIALGLDRGGPGLVYVVVPVLLLVACGTLMLAERRSGLVIMFVGGLAALGMPIIHRHNAFTPAIARAPGGVFFIWTLVALGVIGGLTMLLSAHALWSWRARRV